MMLIEVTSDAAIFLKTWVPREVVSPLQTRSRNDSLLQRTRAHMMASSEQAWVRNSMRISVISVYAARAQLEKIQVLVTSDGLAASLRNRRVKQEIHSSQ